MAINLKKCKPGDILISCHGLKLKYLKYEPENQFPHRVKYPYDEPFHSSEGTRYDDGQVFHKNKLPEDHDIVEVIRGKRVIQVLKSNSKKGKKNNERYTNNR